VSDAARSIEVLSADNVTILDLTGEIDISTAIEFKEAMLQSLEAGGRRIVVDATKVTFMDSSGVSVLISGERRLRPLGSSLAVACSPNVKRILQVAGLGALFALHASRAEAMRAVRAGPGSSAAIDLRESP
jgi:anti-sigma B factor antagonist